MGRRHYRHVLKFPDGRFLVQGFDCADQFTTDPLSATPMTIYSREDDTNEYQGRGAILVQYEITATPTGRTCADIFKEERAEIAAHREAARLEQEEADRLSAVKAADEARLLAKTLGLEP